MGPATNRPVVRATRRPARPVAPSLQRRLGRASGWMALDWRDLNHRPKVLASRCSRGSRGEVSHHERSVASLRQFTLPGFVIGPRKRTASASANCSSAAWLQPTARSAKASLHEVALSTTSSQARDVATQTHRAPGVHTGCCRRAAAAGQGCWEHG